MSPSGALTYSPSNFTASNGTNVIFTFAQYDFFYHRAVYFAHIHTFFRAPGALLIPSHNPRSKTPARIWQGETARRAVSIPGYNLRSSGPSRSQMIKNASHHFRRRHLCPFVNSYDSDLFLLQIAAAALWSWDGWVSNKYINRRALKYACSAINAPATGPNSPDAFLSAAMAIGTNEVSVRHSPSFALHTTSMTFFL